MNNNIWLHQLIILLNLNLKLYIVTKELLKKIHFKMESLGKMIKVLLKEHGHKIIYL